MPYIHKIPSNIHKIPSKSPPRVAPSKPSPSLETVGQMNERHRRDIGWHNEKPRTQPYLWRVLIITVAVAIVVATAIR